VPGGPTGPIEGVQHAVQRRLDGVRLAPVVGGAEPVASQGGGRAGGDGGGRDGIEPQQQERAAGGGGTDDATAHDHRRGRPPHAAHVEAQVDQGTGARLARVLHDGHLDPAHVLEAQAALDAPVDAAPDRRRQVLTRHPPRPAAGVADHPEQLAFEEAVDGRLDGGGGTRDAPRHFEGPRAEQPGGPHRAAVGGSREGTDAQLGDGAAHRLAGQAHLHGHLLEGGGIEAPGVARRPLLQLGRPAQDDGRLLVRETVAVHARDSTGAAPVAGRVTGARYGERMAGHAFATAHRAAAVGPAPLPLARREAREEAEHALLAPGATRAVGAGTRARPEEADPFRTCFERDLDRVHHSRPFRRLAGKCQVFIAPDDDHLRTRLTHAIEVAQVAVGIARPAGLNVALTAAAATAHDCGHGPAGHASEEAFSPFLEGGYHHAVYGADVVLGPLNLCAETLDAVRNHSWNRPAPHTPEGEIVAWADRIAYVCHDFEDAVRAGIVEADDLPADVAAVVGRRRSAQINALIGAVLATIADTGRVGMRAAEAEALAAFRAFNFERIYLRPASVAQADRVVELLRALVEWYATHPSAVDGDGERSGADPVAAAVRHVSGMTDRYALRMAEQHLGWGPDKLPRGV
jgi:dGTPase